MKYRHKDIVEAEIYCPGMEDGFDIQTHFDGSHPVQETSGCFVCYDAPSVVPFIITPEGNKKYISSGDFIVRFEGGRLPCNPTEFRRVFEEVVEE